MAWMKGLPPKLIHDNFGLYNGQWMPEMDRCWMDYDRGYCVCSRMIRTKDHGNVEHVTISRIKGEGDPIVATGGVMPIGWNEKMQIKNELFGENRFAIEIYPKQDRLVDVCDVYHLWVFDKKREMPFGIHPKEYQKAINRGTSFTSEEAKELSARIIEFEQSEKGDT